VSETRSPKALTLGELMLESMLAEGLEYLIFEILDMVDWG
jgi:hypothetical protein